MDGFFGKGEKLFGYIAPSPYGLFAFSVSKIYFFLSKVFFPTLYA